MQFFVIIEDLLKLFHHLLVQKICPHSSPRCPRMCVSWDFLRATVFPSASQGTSSQAGR